MFFPNQTIQVLVDPTVAVLTLSDPEGNVEAGTLISATVGTAGTGGAPGSIDEFEYSGIFPNEMIGKSIHAPFLKKISLIDNVKVFIKNLSRKYL